MNIQERAQKVLAEIDAALALVEKAMPGPWETDRKAKHPAVFTEEGDFIGVDMTPDNATFIAASRTLLPASLRCLKTAIEGLLETIKPFRFPDEDREEAHKSLAALCDQWEVPA